MSGPEYQDALSSLETALRDAVKAFASWHVENWTITREQWKNDFKTPPPKGDYFDGYNAGVASVTDSLDTFLDEFHP